jgi:hypothetical protein
MDRRLLPVGQLVTDFVLPQTLNDEVGLPFVLRPGFVELDRRDLNTQSVKRLDSASDLAQLETFDL